MIAGGRHDSISLLEAFPVAAQARQRDAVPLDLDVLEGRTQLEAQPCKVAGFCVTPGFRHARSEAEHRAHRANGRETLAWRRTGRPWSLQVRGACGNRCGRSALTLKAPRFAPASASRRSGSPDVVAASGRTALAVRRTVLLQRAWSALAPDGPNQAGDGGDEGGEGGDEIGCEGHGGSFRRHSATSRRYGA